MTVKLSSPRIRVVLENPSGELVEYLVQTDNRDLVQWDATRGRRSWPTGQDAPILWLTFCAWHAMRRTGVNIPDTFDAFNELCVGVESAPRDAAGDDDATPTPPAPGTGSSLN